MPLVDIHCHEPAGKVAAGVSSGGIAMKADGRVGEAAVFGAGCFAMPATPGGRWAPSASYGPNQK